MKNHNYINEWNNSSKTYSNLRLKGFDPYEEIVNFPSCIKLLGNIKNKNLLDAGSGTGEFSYLLQKKGAKVVDIDGAKKLIFISKKNFPDVAFKVSDLNSKLPFNNRSFDRILCKYVLMFIDKPEKLLLEFRRILKKDGVLVISNPHPTYWLHYWLASYWNISKREGFSDLEGYFKIKKFSFAIKGDKNLKFTFIHRPLDYYVNLFTKCGFIINEIDEPQSNESLLEKDPQTITALVPKVINFKLTIKN